jgi:3,4-dihydroxy 2-butanone 4-phosphate synthase/GTP cyclohydrolase II
MDAGQHNAAYLQTKRTKLGHMMDGPQVVLAWHGETDPLAWAPHLEQLRHWAAAETLSLEVEDHPRLLALLNQPALAVLLGPGLDRAIDPAQIQKLLATMAGWQGTQAVSLLLAPDGQRSSHPSVELEPSPRPLAELGSPSSGGPTSEGLQLEPGAFLVWR